MQWDIHHGVGLAVWGGRFLLRYCAPAGAKSLTCFGACRSALSCVWLEPIEAKIYLSSVSVLLEPSSSREGLVLSTGNIVSESAKPLAWGLVVSQGACLYL